MESIGLPVLPVGLTSFACAVLRNIQKPDRAQLLRLQVFVNLLDQGVFSTTRTMSLLHFPLLMSHFSNLLSPSAHTGTDEEKIHARSEPTAPAFLSSAPLPTYSHLHLRPSRHPSSATRRAKARADSAISSASQCHGPSAAANAGCVG